MHWRLRRAIEHFKNPILVRAVESEMYGTSCFNVGGGGIVEAFRFIDRWFNHDAHYFRFEVQLIGLIKFEFKPNVDWWANDRTKTGCT